MDVFMVSLQNGDVKRFCLRKYFIVVLGGKRYNHINVWKKNYEREVSYGILSESGE